MFNSWCLPTFHGAVVRQGNEGVEVKEGSFSNVIKNNDIKMQLDAESGGQWEWAVETFAVAGCQTSLWGTLRIKHRSSDQLLPEKPMPPL